MGLVVVPLPSLPAPKTVRCHARAARPPAPHLCVLGGVDGRVRLVVVPPCPRLPPQLPRQDALREGAPAPVARVLRHNALGEARRKGNHGNGSERGPSATAMYKTELTNA